MRFAFYLVGWLGLPLLFKPVYGDRQHIAAEAQTSLWKSYVEMAFRNPTNGMAGWFEQPVPEFRPNPDFLVRFGHKASASRWTKEGIYWEYWYLRSIDFHMPSWVPLFGGKHYKWFEFRIGWKFVDGNLEFFPTFQLGPRSS